MTVSLIIPWRPDPARRRARDFIIGHLLETLEPDEVMLADDPGEPFNRGRALNEGVRRTSGDVLVFADADLWVPAAAMRTAVEVARVAVGYVMPFSRLRFLDPIGTRLVLDGHLEPPEVAADPDLVELEWDRPSTGGCNVIRRTAFHSAGGFDRRFAGWGYEDAAFDIACSTMVGPAHYLGYQAVHLWHPHAPDRGTDATEAGLELCHRYEAAAGDSVALARLILEQYREAG